jgi:hypothetical protein
MSPRNLSVLIAVVMSAIGIQPVFDHVGYETNWTGIWGS